jgi:hypothetical protein
MTNTSTCDSNALSTASLQFAISLLVMAVITQDRYHHFTLTRIVKVVLS